MFVYVLNRLLISIPTLLIISLAVFGLSKCAPGDPVENIYGAEINDQFAPDQAISNYQRHAAELGIDKPFFYFTFTTAAQSDTLWKIFPLSRRNYLYDLVAQNGNWPATRTFDAALTGAQQWMEKLPDSTKNKAFFRLELVKLAACATLPDISAQYQQVETAYAGISSVPETLRQAMERLQSAVFSVCNDRQSGKLRTPALYWNGLNNQYHHWLSGVLTGHWGLTKKKQEVWQELKPALFSSMAVNLIALFFAYLIAIPLGVEMARRKGRGFDRWAQRMLVLLHTMPVFWMGALLIILFSTPIAGKPLIQNPYLDVTDAWDMNKMTFLAWFSLKLPKFILPIIVLVLYSLTIIALQMRAGMVETLGQDYIRTARAKGVQEDDVYWMHAFRNALFPVITIFASVFPAMFTGSLVIETLFNFPGMGLKAQEAFAGHDLVMLTSILLAAAVFTVIGNLVADLLYGWVDPRVRLAADKR